MSPLSRFAAVLSAAILATPIASANLLVNGDFEADPLPEGNFPNEFTAASGGPVNLPTGFSNAFGNVFVTNGAVGNGLFQAVNFTPDPTVSASVKMFGNSGLIQSFTPTPGVAYDFSVRAVNAAADPIGEGSAGFMFIDFIDAAGNRTSGGTSTTIDASAPVSGDPIAPSDWLLLAGATVPTPADAVAAEAFLFVTDFPGAYFFDDISVTPVPEPASAALVGAAGAALLRRRRAV